MREINPPPFKIKMVEQITLPPLEKRETRLKQAHFNVFSIPSEDVYIDLLTDSGTSAMSDRQWSAMFLGDEAYAGSKSFYRLQKTVQELFGHTYIIPTHQGRGAENIFFSSVIKKPKIFIPNNAHFDTTRANIEQLGGQAIDLPCKETLEIDKPYPFKGNMDLEGLKKIIDEKGKDNIPLVMMTITNNSVGGQPASLENIKAVKAILDEHDIPFFLDACRFAENCYFIQQREAGQAKRPLKDIIHEVFSLADGCTFSGKKDALANIGGFITLNKKNEKLFQSICDRLILHEGFKTYGGLAGRDLEAMAQGLKDVIETDYLSFRTKQVEVLGQKLIDQGISIIRPTGGHAVYMNASHFLPHISSEQFPGQALVIALYRHFGIRAVEIGSVMFPTNPPPYEFVRLAIPRRVYTNDHILYVAHALGELYKKRDSIVGVKIVEEPQFLRHFTAKFAEITLSKKSPYTTK